MQHFTYVTPAGITCSCGIAIHTVAGGEASRLAYTHGTVIPEEHTQQIIDYRISSLGDGGMSRDDVVKPVAKVCTCYTFHEPMNSKCELNA